MISYAISLVFKIIYLIIIVVVLISWIPVFNIEKEPLASIVAVYNKIMAPFKAIIPPIGMLDISPIVAIIALQILERLLYSILVPLGL